MHYAAVISEDVLAFVDNSLRAAEMEAVSTARQTPGAARFVRFIADREIPLVIVSNNSTPAILQYVEDQQLSTYVRSVVGRSFARPDLMKPHPGH